MPKRLITSLPDGHRTSSLGVLGSVEAGDTLAKELFELSRTTDMTTHFDPAIHTLAAIASGIPGHVQLTRREVEEADLTYHVLGDRYFRDAVEDDGAVIAVNLLKAQSIHMGQIRKVRNQELASLDVLFQKALEAGDTSEQSRIAGVKQGLRDIPQTFDLSAATTPEALKALWPAELPARG